MKQEVKTKAKENAIVDGPRYECSEMAARFALTWLDRAHHHLKHIGRGKRSFYHDQLVQKVEHVNQELVDLVLKLASAYRGYNNTMSNDPIYKPCPHQDDLARNVFNRPGKETVLRDRKGK